MTAVILHFVLSPHLFHWIIFTKFVVFQQIPVGTSFPPIKHKSKIIPDFGLRLVSAFLILYIFHSHADQLPAKSQSFVLTTEINDYYYFNAQSDYRLCDSFLGCVQYEIFPALDHFCQLALFQLIPHFSLPSVHLCFQCMKELGKVSCHSELVQLATAKHCLALHEVGYRHDDVINDPWTTKSVLDYICRLVTALQVIIST